MKFVLSSVSAFDIGTVRFCYNYSAEKVIRM